MISSVKTEIRIDHHLGAIWEESKETLNDESTSIILLLPL